MGLPPLLSTDWIANSGASFHTTPDAAILSSVRPPNPSCPSSIMVGNGSCLPVTSVGNAGTHGSFRLPNILVAPQHGSQSSADNSCSVEFDSSGLTVRDSASRRPLLRCDSLGPLYTLQFPPSAAPSSTSLSHSSSAAFVTTNSSTTWHCRLGHPGRDALAQLSRGAAITCPQTTVEHLCHVCQLGRHVHLPFPTFSSHASHLFDLIHCDLWTSHV